MCALARPTPTNLVIELSRRLAEDFAGIPLPEVSRVVKRAAAANMKIVDETNAAQLETAMAKTERQARQQLAARSRATPK